MLLLIQKDPYPLLIWGVGCTGSRRSDRIEESMAFHIWKSDEARSFLTKARDEESDVALKMHLFVNHAGIFDRLMLQSR